MSAIAATGKETFAAGLVAERDPHNAGLLTITINRIDDLNRLTPDALACLASIADRLREDRTSNVVLITGAGNEYFSMGILNPAIRASYSKDDIVSIVRTANRAYDSIEALPQLVIAAINGKALAGGVELSLACDLRYAAAHATMTMPEATWGGFPGAGAPVRLPTIVGRARALELICTGRTIDALEMDRLGIVQGVLGSNTFQDELVRTARQIAESGPLAVRGAKRIASARLDPGFKAARELSDALRAALEWSHDVDEGIAAHKEQRKPRFIGS